VKFVTILSSSRTTTSSWLKEELSRKTKEKPRTESKRVCYNCAKNRHFNAQWPYEMMRTTRRKTRHTPRTRKTISTIKRSPMVKLIL
jgi:hypothetical protein